MLLNSAYLQGFSAVREVAATERHLAKLKPLFARAMQFYFLQRWFSRFEGGAAALSRADVLHWLRLLSKEAGSVKADYQRLIDFFIVPEETGGGGARPVRSYRSADMIKHMGQFAPPAGLSFEMVPKWIWNLLKIPFATDIEAGDDLSSEVKAQSKKKGEAPIPFRPLPASSTVLKIVANQFDKSALELDETDYGQVKVLDLNDVQISAVDDPVLSLLVNLERLDLHNSSIEKIECLATLKKLKHLKLSCTPVADLSPLRELEGLETLDLSYSQVEDLTPLANLHKLQVLTLFGSPVKDLKPLQGLSELSRLNLSNTKVVNADLDVLETLPNLTALFLRGTGIDKECITRLQGSFEFNLQVEV